MQVSLRSLTLLVLATLLASLGIGVSGATTSGGFKVVVNPSNPVDELERRFLEEAFLKKASRWNHGDGIRAVDLRPDSATRRQFSDDVLRRSVAAVKNYWQQLIFSGRDVPPPEVDTDEQVVRYVLKHPGGLGYVSANAAVDQVKVVSLR